MEIWTYESPEGAAYRSCGAEPVTIFKAYIPLPPGTYTVKKTYRFWHPGPPLVSEECELRAHGGGDLFVEVTVGRVPLASFKVRVCEALT